MPTDLPKKSKNKAIKKFSVFSAGVSKIVGSPGWFIFSITIVIVWVLSGPFLGWDERWQLTINTTTTILTFLMMALLHSSQSKWEEKMEKLQDREQTNLKAIEKNTKRLTFESGEKPTTAKEIETEEKVQEFVDSLH